MTTDMTILWDMSPERLIREECLWLLSEEPGLLGAVPPREHPDDAGLLNTWDGDSTERTA